MLCPLQAIAAEGGYIVIVNASNPNQELSKVQLQNYYLKKENIWTQSGAKAFPIDLPTSDVLSRRFAEEILDMKVQQLGAYWNKAKAQGLKKPKVIKTSQAVVLKVGTFEGGIGYVKDGTQLTAKVRAVAVQ